MTLLLFFPFVEFVTPNECNQHYMPLTLILQLYYIVLFTLGQTITRRAATEKTTPMTISGNKYSVLTQKISEV